MQIIILTCKLAHSPSKESDDAVCSSYINFHPESTISLRFQLFLTHYTAVQIKIEKHLSSHTNDFYYAKEAITCTNQTFRCQQRWLEHKGGYLLYYLWWLPVWVWWQVWIFWLSNEVSCWPHSTQCKLNGHGYDLHKGSSDDEFPTRMIIFMSVTSTTRGSSVTANCWLIIIWTISTIKTWKVLSKQPLLLHFLINI